MLYSKILIAANNKLYHDIKNIFTQRYDSLEFAKIGSLDKLKEKCKTFQPDLLIIEIDKEEKINKIIENSALLKEKLFPIIFIKESSIKKQLDEHHANFPYTFINKPYHKNDFYSILEILKIKKNTQKYFFNQEEKYQNLVEKIEEAIVIVDDKENFIYLNKKATEIFETARDKLLGKNVADYVSEEEFDKILAQTQKRKKGLTSRYELKIHTAKNNTKYIKISVTPQFKKGKYVGAFGLITDITRNKLNEFELHRKKNQLEKIIEISRQLNKSLNVKKVLERIGTGAKEIIHAQSCIIFVKTDNLLIPEVALDNMHKEQILAQKVPMEKSLVGTVVKNKKGMIFNDPINETKKFQVPKTPIQTKEKIIISPFILDEKVLGAIKLSRYDKDYTKEDLKISETYASYAAIALHNAQIVKNLQTEIKERKIAERDLSKSQSQLSTIFENVPNIVLYEINEHLHFISKNIKNILGYDSDKFNKNKDFFYSLIHPSDKEIILHKIKKWEDNNYQGLLTLWFRIKHSNGNYRWLEDRRIKVKNKDEESFITGILLDNTELKQTEENLKITKERYEAVVEDQTEFINRYDADFKLSFVNKAYCKYIGKSQEELIGKNWLNFFPPSKQSLVRKRLFSLTPENPVATYEYQKRDKLGHEKWEEWTYRAFFDENGIIKEFQSVGKDITKKKKDANLLIKAKNRTHFFNELLSHDINNLNHGIFSYLNIVLENAELPDKARIRLKTCRHLSQEISGLISKVRILAEMEEGDIETKSINLVKIITSCLNNIKVKYKDAVELDINNQIDAQELNVAGNELIETAIYNILNNAVKHNQSNKVKITIRHSQSNYPGYYKFEFLDNGDGVPDSHKRTIFNKMERVNSGSNSEGFGLGLTLVKNIIEKFQGKIWVEDRVIGKPELGSNFIVLLKKSD